MDADSTELPDLIRRLARALAWQAELGALGVSPASLAPIEVPVRPARADTSPAPAPVPAPSLPGRESAPTGAAPEVAGAAAVAARDSVAAAEGLKAVRLELGDCQRCKLCAGRTQIVFGVGNPTAELMFIGEAPGADEDRQGEPFVGKAGQLLTKMIQAMGLQRQDVYIANIIKCRPPQNRDPEPDEVNACEPFLLKQIDVIRPQIIVSLGRISAQTLLRVTTPITWLRGKWKNYHGIRLMPTFHPAYLLRNPAAKKDAWEDLQQVMSALGLDRPGRAPS